MTVDDVFLQMVDRIKRVKDGHMALAVWTTMGSRHIDDPNRTRVGVGRNQPGWPTGAPRFFLVFSEAGESGSAGSDESSSASVSSCFCWLVANLFCRSSFNSSLACWSCFLSCSFSSKQLTY